MSYRSCVLRRDGTYTLPRTHATRREAIETALRSAHGSDVTRVTVSENEGRTTVLDISADMAATVERRHARVGTALSELLVLSATAEREWGLWNEGKVELRKRLEAIIQQCVEVQKLLDE